MFSLFIVLLSFSECLARNRTKCLVLNDEPCMVRPIIIDVHPVELKYYPFVISLNKCTGSFNALSPKICFLKETKGANDKAFNIITNKDEAKAVTGHISCDSKSKFISATCKNVSAKKIIV